MLIKQDYVWNTLAGLINAAEAVILSMIVTRVTDLTDAGILTIAFAIGNLMMTIGKFGIRNYQVTDISYQYSFAIYLKARILTVTGMLLISGIYVFYALARLHYTYDKAGVICAVCLIYAIEAMEDVIWGYYQQRGYLYVGAQMFCARWCGILFMFPLVLVFSHNLCMTLFSCAAFSAVIFLIVWRKSWRRFSAEQDRQHSLWVYQEDRGRMRGLLKTAFPLFGSVFLSYYINNAPKYAIDVYLTEEQQACYGFVAMPVFVIGLLNGFIYQPVLVHMAEDWSGRRVDLLKKRMAKQVWIIIGISLLCLIGAYYFGIPVLSFLYHTDLADYKKELLILLAAGGFLALSGYQGVVLTIMRQQKELLWGYVGVAILAFIMLRYIVRLYGTEGAAVAYLILMLLLCFIYGMMLKVKLKSAGNERGPLL